jgi:phosphatidylethanolamine/phosphatidyl-N-methylethanolamine N-methyltransferase
MTVLSKISMQLSGLAAFTKEVVLHPSSMGAACPSSKYLALAMAKKIPLPLSGQVLELGAGTGVVTAALLEYGVHPHQLFVIEQSQALFQHLKNYFPQITVLHGDAQNLLGLLQGKAQNVSVIVSSLPLLSLPAETAQAIQQQIHDVLQSGGLYIQYTYHLLKVKEPPVGFNYLSSRRIWLNLPPARIDVFQRV